MTELQEQRSHTMRAVHSKNTSAELIVRRCLREIGYSGYRLHRPELPGSPDVAFLGRHKAIFVHGCFWHGHECKRGSRVPKTNREYWVKKIARNVDRDEQEERALRSMGWDVCIIWECELREIERLRARLLLFLS